MFKRGKSKFVFSISVFEILLLVSVSFSFSFILSGDLVLAQDIDPNIIPDLGDGSLSSIDPSAVVDSVNTQFGINGPPIVPSASGIASTTSVPPISNIPTGVSPPQLDIIRAELPTTGSGPVSSGLEPARVIRPPASEIPAGPTLDTPGSLPPRDVGAGELTPPNLPGGGALPPSTASTAVDTNFGPFGKYSLDWFGNSAGNFFAAHLVEGVVWGGVVALAIKFIGPVLGLSEEQSNAASIAAFGGIAGGKLLYGTFAQGGVFAETPILSSIFGTPLGGFVTGGLIAFAIFAATYKTEKKKMVNFQCLPFEPPTGGAKCEECNKDPFRPCSEYRCRSLGQACQLLNPGTNEEKCAWINSKDVNSPTITPWTDALKPTGLSYVPDTTVRPPDRGVKIVRGSEGCIAPFTPLEFGIILNEPAQCKLDYNINASFEEMEFYFGESNYHRYNHTQKIKLPGPDTGSTGALSPELINDGSFSLYTQCRDANGNVNVDKFVFNFCVDKSPDTTPPIIEGTNINSGGFVRYNSDSVPIEVYTNEPSECKWTRENKNYDTMENSMTCLSETFQINANLNYVCSGNLTGVKNQADNSFFFRCKDQPNKEEKDRNVNTESKELILKGSQPLNILGTQPNQTIFGNTNTISVDLEVKTDDGSEEGKSICYFSNSGLADSYISMFESNSFEHRQKLDLVAGNYKYYFRCVDAGGNTAEDSTAFTVNVDKSPPMVTRAYKEEGIKIVTNEEAECVYDLKSCNYVFEEGLPMIYSNPSLKQNHYAEWKSNSVYHIKCRDLYNNQPSPNQCNIIINSIDLTKEK